MISKFVISQDKKKVTITVLNYFNNINNFHISPESQTFPIIKNISEKYLKPFKKNPAYRRQ